MALLVLTVSLSGRACAAVVLDDRVDFVDLAGRMDVLRDADGSLAIDDMARPDIANRFTPLNGDLTAGYDRAAYWLRIPINEVSRASGHWLLEVGGAYLDHVGLFTPGNGRGFHAVKTGDRTPFSTRPLPHRTFVFDLALPPGESQVIYLRIQSTSTLAVTARIWSKARFAAAAAAESLALGLVAGGMLVIALISLFQYAIGRDGLYLLHFAYVLAATTMFGSANGLLAQHVFPGSPILAERLTGVGASLMLGFGLAFTSRLLDLGAGFPRLGRAYSLAGWGLGACALSVLADAFQMVAPVISGAMVVFLPTTTVLALVQTLRGERGAIYFLLAMLVCLMALTLPALKALGLDQGLPVNTLVVQASVAVHTALLLLGLLHRSAGLNAVRLELSRRAERELERRVAERTAELAETNTTLAAEVAERRAAEGRLRESERQVRAILDAAPFPMLVVTYPEGRFMFLNQPAAELINIPTDSDLSGLRTRDFYVNPAERDQFIWKLRESGCVLGAELEIRRIPDERRWTLLSAVRFTYRNEEAVLICLNDISTRKLLEESLRLAGLRSEAALETSYQAMREQRNFLSMVSHEFRVPLAIIEAASQLLGIYSEADSEAQDEVAKIGRAVRRMSDLIDVCLADDRLDSNTMSLRVVEFDLASTLADLRDDKRPFAANRYLTLKANGPALIQADATLLRVAFSNLIDNALKFSPPESPVEVRIIADPEGIMVSVSDRGPGIALEEQPRIFEKFFRSTKADRIRGAGLGLYIVRRIIDLHGGSIAVDSMPGQGATFVVWLPLIPPPTAPIDGPMA
ncbi:sensor histidine kinase [Paramagnetospirillum marisnigri]|uniref:sensor histidine kinase n=1 Tax=Paramagnetospirillum marisnigri TaxID=1285242 RepID=UPI001FE22CAF|nr:7TM-DISM domain-containing protein [Paramagnetospirillum marisnigri]